MHGQWGDSIAADPFGIVALVAGLVFAFAVGALWIGFGLVRLAVAALS